MAIVKELPEDLLMEILWRLPVKSLLRMRSVCKNWCALMQNPRFIALHYNRNRRRRRNNNDDKLEEEEEESLLLVWRRQETPPQHGDDDGDYVLSLVHNETPVEDLDLSFTGIHELPCNERFVLSCCNGVVCLSDYSKVVVLYNPAIKEFKVLPQPIYKTYCTSHVGFGFDPQTNDYKVVRVATLYDYSRHYDCLDPEPGQEDSDEYKEYQKSFDLYEREDETAEPWFRFKTVDEKVEIYDLSTDSWRDQVNAIMPQDFFYDAYSCTSFNGDFYWFAHRLGSTDKAIIAFRMSGEFFEKIAAPPNLHYTIDLYILNDSLALVDNFEVVKAGYSTVGFDIWVMNEYGGCGVKEEEESSWTKKYTIEPIFPYGSRAVGFLQNGEFLVARNVNPEPVIGEGPMESYNLYTQEIIKEYQVYGRCNVLRICLLYTESLVSVKRRHD